MSNRFGLEDINDCETCGAETLNVRFCPDCQDARLDAREYAEELNEIEFPR